MTYDPIHNFHTEGVGEAKQNTNLLAIKGNTDLNERDQADFGICNENSKNYNQSILLFLE